MLKWNQKTIHEWGIRTFGQAALNTLGVAIRMTKEAVELSYELNIDDRDDVIKESADVAIVLLQVSNCLGFDCVEALKMQPLNDLYLEVSDACVDQEQCSKLISEFSVVLISSIFHGELHNAKTIIIKIMAVLDSIEDLYEFSLSDEIQKKMEINVARTWAVQADGSRQHV